MPLTISRNMRWQRVKKEGSFSRKRKNGSWRKIAISSSPLNISARHYSYSQTISVKDYSPGRKQSSRRILLRAIVQVVRSSREPASRALQPDFPKLHRFHGLGKVQSELTLRALSYGLVVLLGITLLALSLVSIRKENRQGRPINGIIWFTVAIRGSCAVLALLAGYAQKARSLERVSHRVEE